MFQHDFPVCEYDLMDFCTVENADNVAGIFANFDAENAISDLENIIDAFLNTPTMLK